MTHSSANFINYYEVLGVTRDAPQDAIKVAFHRLSRAKHTGQQSKDSEHKKAFETLYGPAQRALFDYRLQEHELAQEHKKEIKALEKECETWKKDEDRRRKVFLEKMHKKAAHLKKQHEQKMRVLARRHHHDASLPEEQEPAPAERVEECTSLEYAYYETIPQSIKNSEQIRHRLFALMDNPVFAVLLDYHDAQDMQMHLTSVDEHVSVVRVFLRELWDKIEHSFQPSLGDDGVGTFSPERELLEEVKARCALVTKWLELSKALEALEKTATESVLNVGYGENGMSLWYHDELQPAIKALDEEYGKFCAREM